MKNEVCRKVGKFLREIHANEGKKLKYHAQAAIEENESTILEN